jgi:small GTP-binding protein
MQFTISLIGEAGVGKTKIAQRLFQNEFTTPYKPTVGGSMVKIWYEGPGHEPKLFLIWDTAGQERYRSLAPVFYRDSVAAVVVYDVSEQETFERVPDWMTLYRGSCDESNPILIIGNKLDLSRAVDTEDGVRFAETHGCRFIEVSALEGTNMDRVLPTISDMIDHSNTAVQERLHEKPARKKDCCG